MRLGVIDGPGHHGALIVTCLTANGHEVLHTRAHPGFSAIDHRQRQLARPAVQQIHDTIRWVTSAAQHRLRRLAGLRTSYDFDLYTRMYAKIAARYFDDVEAIIGFSLVSLDAHQRAKALGHTAILELPSIHLLEHLDLAAQEYELAGQAAPRDGIIFSRFAKERATHEYEQADLIQSLSSFAKKTLVKRGIPEEKIVVSPLGIDVSLFQPAAPKTERPFRVLCVGRIELVKGIRYLIDAFARAKIPEAELWFVGALFQESVPFLSAQDKGVKVLPPVPQEELAKIYQQADVLVFPTLSDGMGLVILEAMACGLPVIATENSGAPDILREGVDGFIVPIRDSDALAQKMRWLSQNEEARVVMGQRARARVESMFTRAHYGERLVSIISAISGRHRSG